MLGHALVVASGVRDYGTLVDQRICGPLDLVDTTVTLTPAQRARLADGHRRCGHRAGSDHAAVVATFQL